MDQVVSISSEVLVLARRMAYEASLCTGKRVTIKAVVERAIIALAEKEKAEGE